MRANSRSGKDFRRGERREMAHLKTFAVATGFGLCAYAVVQILVIASRKIGFLQWIAS
jgi:hypothetical protein